MTTTTHDPNITINVTLDPSPAQEAGFGVLLLLVPLSANSLDGDRMMTFTSYEDAVAANTGGFISSSTLAAAAAAFAQRPKPETFKVGYVDDSAATPAVKASKDFGVVGTGAFDTELEAHTGGVDGNDITVELVGDSSTTVSITRIGTAFQIHVKPGTSTVTNVETAIAALSGADDLVDIKVGGTGATVLQVADCNMGATHLANGADAVATEGYDDGLAACIAYDSDFYGVAITSRDEPDMVDVSVYVESASKKMLFALQDADASWLTSGIPSGLSSIDGNERTVAYYHDTDSVWSEVGAVANRLVYDPDSKSVPWHGYPVRSVDSYATVPTAAQRLLCIANNGNMGLPYGGEDYVIDPGTNLNSRPVDEILTADWFSTRLQERIAELVVQHGARGEKIVVDKTGQKKVLAVIDGLLAQGVGAGHFVDGQTESVAETITSADITARRMRFTIRAQSATSARLFVFNAYFSRDPIADNA